MSFQLADLFEAVADADPDREVVVVGDRRLTYRQLDQRANRLARALSARGVGVDDTVGLQLVNSTEYLEGMLAAFKLRAVPVNINYRYVERELGYLYDDAGLTALICHRAFAGRAAAVPSVPKTFLVVDDGTAEPLPGAAEDYTAALAAQPGTRPEVAGRSDDDRYLIYTGGTTGMPKGVVWRHEDIFKAAMGGGDLAQQGDYVADEKELAARLPDVGIAALAAPPLMHASAHWLAFHQLFCGGKVVLLPGGRFDAAQAWRTIAAEQVFVLVVVGDAMARPLVDELAAHPDRYDTSTLWVIASSGAGLSAATKERLLELLPNRLIADTFGSSETGVLGAKEESGALRVNEHTAVLDASGARLQPGSGAVGKIARSGHVPLRYHQDPERSARTFVTVGGRRWALTGDDATVEEDGTIRVLGRGTQCINTGGEKVYPEEVEEALRGHAALADVVVVGVPDERWGERVVAVVAPAPESAPDLASVQEFARQHLAGYKVPRGLVVVDEVVRSPAGKPDYAWARAAAREA
jgi:acyl-CoA synthetase (AMP-forming)/AMP-acid ligase II